MESHFEIPLDDLITDIKYNKEDAHPYQCPICLRLLWKPVQCTVCTCNWCRFCLNRYHSTKKTTKCFFTCPSTSFKPNTSLQSELAKLIVNCSKKCGQTLQYDEIEEHILNTCKNGDKTNFFIVPSKGRNKTSDEKDDSYPHKPKSCDLEIDNAGSKGGCWECFSSLFK